MSLPRADPRLQRSTYYGVDDDSGEVARKTDGYFVVGTGDAVGATGGGIGQCRFGHLG
jgi:hypothetical protein